ncbi:uncharacterized protein LOC143035805 [Oratosquilla oratoria]|uniref:uncharacterized protein LOC143035805 n=1 Tax=Oratosquilla oratoria TaxID=337810 RepID=UPI003F75C54A
MRSPRMLSLLIPFLSPILSSLLPDGNRSDQNVLLQSGEGRDSSGGPPSGESKGRGGGRSQLGLADALRVVKVDVPSSVKSGDTVQLVCHYDLEGDHLYSLTWWRGRDQFYQYSPDSISPLTIYTAPGIHVDKHQSGGNVVILKNVSRTSAGVYKCEVLADVPSFEKDSKKSSMDVVVVPETTPHIEVSHSQYSPGEILEANCSLTGAAPPPRLQWMLNGEPITDPNVRLVAGARGNPVLQVRLSLRPQHFTNEGRASLVCTATLQPFYYRTTEAVLTLPGIKAAAPVQKLYGGAYHCRAYFGLVPLCILLQGLSRCL